MELPGLTGANAVRLKRVAETAPRFSAHGSRLAVLGACARLLGIDQWFEN